MNCLCPPADAGGDGFLGGGVFLPDALGRKKGIANLLPLILDKCSAWPVSIAQICVGPSSAWAARYLLSGDTAREKTAAPFMAPRVRISFLSATFQTRTSSVDDEKRNFPFGQKTSSYGKCVFSRA